MKEQEWELSATNKWGAAMTREFYVLQPITRKEAQAEPDAKKMIELYGGFMRMVPLAEALKALGVEVKEVRE